VGVINLPNVSGTTFTPSTAQALTPGHSFTWFAIAMSTNGQAFNYLPSGQSFSLDALAAPALTNPSGIIHASAGYDMPTFTWGSAPGANHYYLYVLDRNTGMGVINLPNVSGTTFTPSTAQALTPGHSFTWFAIAFSTNGQAISYVTTGQPFSLDDLATPNATSPSSNSTVNTTTPTFVWTTDAGANHYDIYVVDNGTGAVIRNPNASGTSWTTTTPLTAGHHYTWYLGAVSTNGLDEKFNSGMTFTVS
jgi:hypothetical protein